MLEVRPISSETSRNGRCMSESTRRDARRNHDRLLRVARQVFAERGVDAPMTTVARSAGLAPATLYRHFPTRAALTAAVFTGDLEACTTLLDEGLADPDPRRGLVMVLDEVARQQVQDPAWADAFLGHAPSLPAFDALRRRTDDLLGELVRRAQSEGGLREDFTTGDVYILLFANRGLAALAPEAALRASRRLMELFVEACFDGPADHVRA